MHSYLGLRFDLSPVEPANRFFYGGVPKFKNHCTGSQTNIILSLCVKFCFKLGVQERDDGNEGAPQGTARCGKCLD